MATNLLEEPVSLDTQRRMGRRAKKVQTKPFRIYEDVADQLGIFARALGLDPADFVDATLRQLLDKHRAEVMRRISGQPDDVGCARDAPPAGRKPRRPKDDPAV